MYGEHVPDACASSTRLKSVFQVPEPLSPPQGPTLELSHTRWPTPACPSYGYRAVKCLPVADESLNLNDLRSGA